MHGGSAQVLQEAVFRCIKMEGVLFTLKPEALRLGHAAGSRTAAVQVVQEPVFNVLRTKQQLGYSVGASLRLTHGLLGFSFHIISGGHCSVVPCSMYIEDMLAMFYHSKLKHLHQLPRLFRLLLVRKSPRNAMAIKQLPWAGPTGLLLPHHLRWASHGACIDGSLSEQAEAPGHAMAMGHLHCV